MERSGNMGTIRSGRGIFGPYEHGVFELLGQFEPGAIVDAGAAAGHMTKLALAYSPDSFALAFEPFPGNWPFLEKTLAGKRATIIKEALAEQPGEASFYVGSTSAKRNGGLGLHGPRRSPQGCGECWLDRLGVVVRAPLPAPAAP